MTIPESVQKVIDEQAEELSRAHYGVQRALGTIIHANSFYLRVAEDRLRRAEEVKADFESRGLKFPTSAEEILKRASSKEISELADKIEDLVEIQISRFD